jgi:divalent metal cation (Fe/Co/Zn/Cd) transporter
MHPDGHAGSAEITPGTHRASGYAFPMASELGVRAAPFEVSDERDRLVRRARLLAWGGIGWHFIEFAIALAAGIAASSIALIGFGVDSLIESVAGFILLWRFAGRRLSSERAERRAQQLIAISFLVLAAYVGAEAIRTLIAADHPETSWVGIGLAAFTAPTMPLLAIAKRRVGNRLGSAATVQEGVQNMVCAYLSIALLIGLLANALVGWWWADPAAALVIAAVALREGRESWGGEGCCETC